MKHPAKFSDPILYTLRRVTPKGLIIDPFAGIGRCFELNDDERTVVGLEIEPAWTANRPGSIVGNALELPFPNHVFDGAVTSPCYGNRFADSHNAKDGSLRRSYTHDLRATLDDSTAVLHEENAGRLHWGPDYREFHERAWAELYRVLKPDSKFVLNVSDFVRNRKIVPVSDWHSHVLERLGFQLIGHHKIDTRRMRYGDNRELRAPNEWVAIFQKW